MPEDPPKATLAEIVATLKEAGYSITHPNATDAKPTDWGKVGTALAIIITVVSSLFSAGNLAQRPHGATPEQVDQVVEKRVKETGDQVVDKVAGKVIHPPVAK